MKSFKYWYICLVNVKVETILWQLCCMLSRNIVFKKTSNILLIHLGSKLRTYLSTTKLLLFGIHYPTICVLFLQHHLLKLTTLSSHCLPLNSTNNWKNLHFPSIPSSLDHFLSGLILWNHSSVLPHLYTVNIIVCSSTFERWIWYVCIGIGVQVSLRRTRNEICSSRDSRIGGMVRSIGLARANEFALSASLGLVIYRYLHHARSYSPINSTPNMNRLPMIVWKNLFTIGQSRNSSEIAHQSTRHFTAISISWSITFNFFIFSEWGL